MKRKLFIILSTLVLIITLIFSFVFKDNKENNKEISKVEKLLSKPEGIQAYTLNGEKTNISFNELINGYTINKITCKNGTVATYNKTTNEVSLSNIKIPDYCTMDFKHSIYSKLLADNKTIKTRTDFSSVFTETNTGTLYKATESIVGSTPKEVYYFAGNAKNNWVKFGGFYWRIIRTNHDGSIRLLYHGTSPEAEDAYISSSTVYNSLQNDSMYVGYMYGTSGSLENNRKNTNDSTIKSTIDTWYKNNLTNYTKYLSVSEGNYTSNENITFYYSGKKRISDNKTPSYDCKNIKDAFSVDNIEAKLTYPIALMTADEISYAGGLWATVSKAWYYYNSLNNKSTGKFYWDTITPFSWTKTYSDMYMVHSETYDGVLGTGYINSEKAVRPVISLKGNLVWKSGDGSSNNPYEVEDLPPTLSKKLLADNPTIKTRTDFSATFTETNTGTLYKATESIAGNTPKDVYYFAGNATNNWVKFGGFYWRIIRTNHDGSVRLLYAGTSLNTTEGYIGTSAFNTKFNNPKYVGYMYGDLDADLDKARANTNNSTIKTYIDNWYSNNLSAYTKYLSKDAVYCNDREPASGSSYSISSGFNYASFGRLTTNKTPTYNCTNIKDAFSGSNNEANLTYSIGLMTADEIAYAGGISGKNNPSAWYYLNGSGVSITGSTLWWLLSPGTWYGNASGVFYINGSSYPGYLNNGAVDNLIGVRPVISLKGNLVWKSGDGSSVNPYEVEDLPPTLSETIKSCATSHTNGVYNENGYRYEGSNPSNYIYMTNKSTNEKELWRIIGVFNDGANGEEVIRVRRHYEQGSYPTMAYDEKNTNHFPNTTMYNTLSSTYNLTNYIHTVNFKMYLGTSSVSTSLTSLEWYTTERGTTPGLTAKNNYNSSTSFIGSVGIMYPSDYGYAVRASDCPRTKSLGGYSVIAACLNDNWLLAGDNRWQWLISPSVSSADSAFTVVNGNVNSNGPYTAGTGYYAYNTWTYSPVMSLDTGVMASGSGTKSDPYMLVN